MTIAVTRSNPTTDTHLYTWAALVSGDADGESLEVPGASDKTVTIEGTFDTGTLTMQGSNDGSTWFTLTDPQGNNIAKTATAMELIMEHPRFIRPLLSGAGTDSITVRVMCRRTK